MGYTEKDKERCRRCIHSFTIGTSKVFCDYMANTGKRRSTICRGGVDCTVFEPRARAGKQSPMVVRPTTTVKKRNCHWDKDAAYRLYQAGAKDVEIAKDLNITKSTVCHWRKKWGLPVQKGDKKKWQ